MPSVPPLPDDSANVGGEVSATNPKRPSQRGEGAREPTTGTKRPRRVPAIEIACPNCESEFRVRASLAGRMVRCKECEQPIRVPAGTPRERPPEEASIRTDSSLARRESDEPSELKKLWTALTIIVSLMVAGYHIVRPFVQWRQREKVRKQAEEVLGELEVVLRTLCRQEFSWAISPSPVFLEDRERVDQQPNGDVRVMGALRVQGKTAVIPWNAMLRDSGVHEYKVGCLSITVDERRAVPKRSTRGQVDCRAIP